MRNFTDIQGQPNAPQPLSIRASSRCCTIHKSCRLSPSITAVVVSSEKWMRLSYKEHVVMSLIYNQRKVPRYEPRGMTVLIEHSVKFISLIEIF